QQIIADGLRELFPNVQVIATTHSPLIVAGMPAEQVIRLRRDSHGTVVQVPVTSGSTMGRTDQLLTGRLFDLPTALDPETERQIVEYQKLLTMSTRTEEQEDR